MVVYWLVCQWYATSCLRTSERFVLLHTQSRQIQQTTLYPKRIRVGLTLQYLSRSSIPPVHEETIATMLPMHIYDRESGLVTQTLQWIYFRRSASCVQSFDDSLDMYFALLIAFRCVLHR